MKSFIPVNFKLSFISRSNQHPRIRCDARPVTEFSPQQFADERWTHYATPRISLPREYIDSRNVQDEEINAALPGVRGEIGEVKKDFKDFIEASKGDVKTAKTGF